MIMIWHFFANNRALLDSHRNIIFVHAFFEDHVEELVWIWMLDMKINRYWRGFPSTRNELDLIFHLFPFSRKNVTFSRALLNDTFALFEDCDERAQRYFRYQYIRTTWIPKTELKLEDFLSFWNDVYLKIFYSHSKLLFQYIT